ncbi:MAG: SRPBCC family protein [Elainellaceae cyanobacterium]
MVLSTEQLKPLSDVIGHLSPTEQQYLNFGNAVVHVVGDRYVSYVVAHANVDQAWSVLTDYDNFAQFLPSVESSRVLESEGDRAVVEQIAGLKVLFADMKSRVCTENIKTPKERIDFRLLEGDLKMMEGHWQLIPVKNDELKGQDSQPIAVIKQAVRVEVGNPLLEGAFEAVYIKNMKRNLMAIAREARNRQG